MGVYVRADDFGYCQGVNRGIVQAINQGVINNVGMMVNMPYANQAFKLIKNKDICLGLHANISVGKPIRKADEIPSLVNNGYFKASKIYRNAIEDFVSLDQAILEIQAQVDMFVSLSAQKPKYIDFHAVCSQNFIHACRIVAKKNKIPFIGMDEKNMEVVVSQQETDIRCLSEFDTFIKKSKKEDILIVYHPGYVDEDLIATSSLTNKRECDVSFLTSEILKKYIEQEKINFLKIENLKIREDS